MIIHICLYKLQSIFLKRFNTIEGCRNWNFKMKEATEWSDRDNQDVELRLSGDQATGYIVQHR